MIINFGLFLIFIDLYFFLVKILTILEYLPPY
jgi:hypothetical protein